MEKRDMAELILMVITIGAHWSPMESIGVGGVGGVCTIKRPPQRLGPYNQNKCFVSMSLELLELLESYNHPKHSI